jgi:probable HAF family extracellular repeat protein
MILSVTISLIARCVSLLSLIAGLPTIGVSGPINYTFTTIDDPSGPAGPPQMAAGINDLGQIVGSYDTLDGDTHGFLDNAGAFTTVDYPNARLTELWGVNDSGEIVGDASVGGAFLDIAGVPTTIAYPGSGITSVSGINSQGQIVGQYADSTGDYGFLDTSGTFTLINCGPLTSARGINDQGQIVGNANGSGFLYANGTCTTINVPGSTSTYVTGINDSGQIVGYYSQPTGIANTHGFIEMNGVFATIDDPNGIGSTAIFGINNSGDIVGSYDGVHNAIGFEATVPEPGSLLLTTGGLMVLAFVLHSQGASSRKLARLSHGLLF